jgi:hypothetical protein
MQTAWVFGNTEDILKLPRPIVRGYLTYGGDVYGNSTHWPEVAHVMEPQCAAPCSNDWWPKVGYCPSGAAYCGASCETLDP